MVKGAGVRGSGVELLSKDEGAGPLGECGDWAGEVTEALEHSREGGERLAQLGVLLCCPLWRTSPPFPSSLREKLEKETVKHETWGHSINLQEKSLIPMAWEDWGLGCLSGVLGKSLQMNLK